MEEKNIPKPVGQFIVENSTMQSIATHDGQYYHYADVCWILKAWKREFLKAENEIDASDAPDVKHDVYADVRNLECEADSTDTVAHTSSAALETRIDYEKVNSCPKCGRKDIGYSQNEIRAYNWCYCGWEGNNLKES